MKKILMIILVLGCTYIINAQTQSLATDNRDVRIFPSNNAQSEIHISINKTHPSNLIVGANTYTNTYSQGHYYTIDGGTTWFGGDNMPHNAQASGDPTTAFDASGRGYITTMISNSQLADGYGVQYTDDRGNHWSEQARGSGPSGGFDKEMIVCVDEMQSSPYANHFYCAWTDFGDNQVVKINRSVDGISTFENNQTLSQTFGQGTNVQIGPEGEVYVCWADYTNGNIPAQNMGFAFSLDGGDTYNSTLVFPYRGIRTTNGANSRFGYTRINDFPAMAVDKSCLAYRGRIYIAYPEFESNNSRRSVIQLSYSDDNGLSWSQPTTINTPNGRQNWFPWIAVDDLTGLVNVVYYSLDQEENNTITNTYVAYSIDGGDSWQNIKVSDESHRTAPIDNNTFAEGYAGDYIGIASFEGTSYASWSDNRSGVWQIYVSKIDYDLPIKIASQSNLEINKPKLINDIRTYEAYYKIRVSNDESVQLQSNAQVELLAGEEITMHPGFSTSSGSSFIAKIEQVEACSTPGASFFKANNSSLLSETNISRNEQEGILTFAYPNPSTDYITIGCENDSYQKAQLNIIDMSGKTIYEQQATFTDNEIRFVVETSTYPKGIYAYTIILEDKVIHAKFLKN